MSTVAAEPCSPSNTRLGSLDPIYFRRRFPIRRTNPTDLKTYVDSGNLGFPATTTNNLVVSFFSDAQMEAKVGRLFDKVGTFFNGKDHLPTCESDIVVGCEREVAEAEKGPSDDIKRESIMSLTWALVHSKRPEDIQRGIAMLKASLNGNNSPLQMRERMYLLAVGYYREGDFSRSGQFVEQCLEIAPDWGQALNLKSAIEERITKDGVIGMGIAVTAIGLVAGGIAAALSRK